MLAASPSVDFCNHVILITLLHGVVDMLNACNFAVAVTRWGSLSAPPDPVASIKGVLVVRGRKRRGEGRGGKGYSPPPPRNVVSWIRQCFWTRNSPLNFRSHPDRDRIHAGGGLSSPSALVIIIIVIIIIIESYCWYVCRDQCGADGG